jgi:hypothetical protein
MPVCSRSIITVCFTLFSTVAALAAEPARPEWPLTNENVADGWIALFDGATLFGWTPTGGSQWTVRDGVVSCTSQDPAFLMTNVDLADFELVCDVKLSPGGNSGLFLRTRLEPKDPVTDCYEFNICDSHPKFKTASLVGVAQPAKPISGEGEWKTWTVRCEGNRVVGALDGETVLDFTDSRPGARRRGRIGLQHREGVAEFRHIRARPLAAKPLFNGRDLAGWRVVPGGASQFTVGGDGIHVENGRGFLETESTFGDFALQATVRTNGEGLNSGIFFRAQPGTATAPSNGYECQIHNLFKDNDRSKPADFGTGGIYRRVPARRVVSNDREWTHLTLIASGPHLSVWVNGEQVTDWTDTRAPNDNPREGLRTAPGHISLQGHDPTTNLDFKSISIAAYPEDG